jgi:8-oxo-dGTP pyrophosphatase MutT (NUDIX family)
VEEAAVRETWEEIRVRATIVGPPRIYSYKDGGTVTVVYPASFTGRPSPGPESQCVESFGPEDLPWRELAFRNVFHGLKDWVESAGRRS